MTAAAREVDKPELPPKQRVAILQLVAAAGQVFLRYYQNDEADICGTYWAAYGTAFWLGLSSPVVRFAMAVGDDPHRIADRIAGYHAVAQADPRKAQQAEAEFEAVFKRMRRRPLAVVKA